MFSTFALQRNKVISSLQGFPNSLVGKESACNAGDPGSIPGLGTSVEERIGYPLQPEFLGFPCGSAGKESVHNAGDLGSIRGLERSPGEGKGYPLQFRGATGEGKGYRLQYSAWRIPWPVYSPWCPKELDTTEQLSPSLLFPPNLCLYMCLVWVHKAPRFLAPNRRTKLSLRIYYSISAASSLCLPISVQFSRSVVSASL